MSWRYRAFIPKDYQEEFMRRAKAEKILSFADMYRTGSINHKEISIMSKREEAKKIRQYMINHTDVPITIHDGYFIRIGDREGVSCKKGNTVYWDDCKWVVSQFVFEGGATTDECIIDTGSGYRCVAKYARLRPDNGAKEVFVGGMRSVRYGSTQVSFTPNGQNYLDMIINRREEKWVKVLYNDGKVILSDEHGYVGLAKSRGQHVTMPGGIRYEIVGYSDKKDDAYTLTQPIMDNVFLKHCLLQEV